MRPRSPRSTGAALADWWARARSTVGMGAVTRLSRTPGMRSARARVGHHPVTGHRLRDPAPLHRTAPGTGRRPGPRPPGGPAAPSRRGRPPGGRPPPARPGAAAGAQLRPRRRRSHPGLGLRGRRNRPCRRGRSAGMSPCRSQLPFVRPHTYPHTPAPPSVLLPTTPYYFLPLPPQGLGVRRWIPSNPQRPTLPPQQPVGRDRNPAHRR